MSDLTKTDFGIDPSYAQLDTFESELVRNVWRDKYQWKDETFAGMAERVAFSINGHEPDYQHVVDARSAILDRLWMPAGRILAGAGTSKRVTLLNCFVNAKLEDDMRSISDGLVNTMLTQQMGGGIGTDFSPIRPVNSILRRTGSTASGPGPFIDTYDSAGTTVRSAGDRRGAQMGTMICTHPDLLNFIKAKQEKGRWTNFNVSVLITDDFMGALAEDDEWLLYHEAEPAYERPQDLVDRDFWFDDDNPVTQYVYSVHRARDLWDEIIKATYVYAEPGVIFIDRVNAMNNLAYCEDIRCTNPCGEQPLPPHGCCDLGAAVLSRMVKHPFTEDAEFDWDLLKDIVTIGVRFLDNVIDVTDYPLPQQRKEEMDKRRIGIGISGLADAMHMLGMRYGSPKSCQFTEKVMREVAFAAYRASVQLAKEKGSFPLFNAEELLKRPFIQQLPQDIQDGIRDGFLRNGVLLTIAPTGTTSIAYGNGSSGLEPVFAHSMGRKVRQNDNSWLSYTEIAYGAKLYLTLNPEKQLEDLPAYMNVCDEVKIYEHVRIQEVCQKWVDASISKTINVPEDIDFEAFKEVYQLAYDSGLKGCTTYRPSEVRGSILTTTADPQEAGVSAAVLPGAAGVLERPETVISQTIKIRWQGLTSALFLTVGFVDGKPYEVFLNSKDQKALEWTMALTILMSQGLRAGIPIEKMCDEFQQIAALEGGWGDGIIPGKQQYWPSLIAYIGFKIRQLLNTGYEVGNYLGNSVGVQSQPFVPPSEADSQFRATEEVVPPIPGKQCPVCNVHAVINLSGCDTCSNCGYSKCG